MPSFHPLAQRSSHKLSKFTPPNYQTNSDNAPITNIRNLRSRESVGSNDRSRRHAFLVSIRRLENTCWPASHARRTRGHRPETPLPRDTPHRWTNELHKSDYRRRARRQRLCYMLELRREIDLLDHSTRRQHTISTARNSNGDDSTVAARRPRFVFWSAEFASWYCSCSVQSSWQESGRHRLGVH